MKRIGIYISCICFGLMGCESMIQEVPAPDDQPQLVVSSILSNQSGYYQAEVTMSKPVFGPVDFEDHEKVEDAMVIISDGEQTMELKHGGDGLYSLSDATKWTRPERTFTIDVSRPNGMSVHSSCTAPNANRPLIEVKLDSNLVSNILFEASYITEVSINDIAPANDYYRIIGYMRMNNGKVRNISFGQTYRMFDDKDRNGETIKLTGSNTKHDGIFPREITIALFKLDPNLYHYYNSLNTGVNDLSEDVPFLEPTIIPSNIENGLGVFGAQHVMHYSFIF